ncbi:unknown protein [Desulfotalea psychrophila LSv54]|uniref:Uncharacterized protein n=1 Tax=Desulfotalea psychrophila (strain LSv54 / DSM 12343) TaxID=177439 RepID=Q6ALI6_DESPS|nr:unknown protein [Desulfotalea psychrophila LSv54]
MDHGLFSKLLKVNIIIHLFYSKGVELHRTERYFIKITNWHHDPRSSFPGLMVVTGSWLASHTGQRGKQQHSPLCTPCRPGSVANPHSRFSFR